MLIGVDALNHVEGFQLVNRWIGKLIVSPEGVVGTVVSLQPSSLLPPPLAPCSRHRGWLKFADVGTKVIPSMLTAALGVVKVKRLLEVSGHQRVMHGSRPRDGSSPVVKVRASRPGLSAATDMKRVCSHSARLCLSVFYPRGIRTRHVVYSALPGFARLPHVLTEIDFWGKDQIWTWIFIRCVS